jgi:hypothetical protein
MRIVTRNTALAELRTNPLNLTVGEAGPNGVPVEMGSEEDVLKIRQDKYRKSGLYGAAEAARLQKLWQRHRMPAA